MMITGVLGSIGSEGEVLSGKYREPLKEDSGTGGLFMQILGTLMACGQDVLPGPTSATCGPAPETRGSSPLMWQLKLPGWLMGKPGSALLQGLEEVPMLLCKLPPGIIMRQEAWDNDHRALALQTAFDGFKDSGVKQQLEILPELPAGLLCNRKSPEGGPVFLEEFPDGKTLSDSEKLYPRFPSKGPSLVGTPESRPGAIPVKMPEEKPLVEYQPVKATKPETAGDLAGATLSPGLAKGVSAQANVVDDVPLEQVTRVVVMKIQRLIDEGQQKVNLQLKLKPSHLGDLTVKIYLEKGGELKAHFYTDNSTVRDVIEATLNQLKDTLAAQRLLLQEAAVFLGDGSGNFNRDGWLNRCFEAGTRLPGPGNQVAEDKTAILENSSLSNSLVDYLI